MKKIMCNECSTCPEELEQEFRQLLRFRDDQERLEFEAEMIHLCLMDHIRTIMKEHEMNITKLAEVLNTTEGEIHQLFSGERLMNLILLAQFQRIFHIQFFEEPSR
jgi:DNA-directed RNA polymerase subunit F